MWNLPKFCALANIWVEYIVVISELHICIIDDCKTYSVAENSLCTHHKISILNFLNHLMINLSVRIYQRIISLLYHICSANFRVVYIHYPTHVTGPNAEPLWPLADWKSTVTSVPHAPLKVTVVGLPGRLQ